MVGNFLDCSLLLRLHVYYMATVVCHTMAITVITCFAKFSEFIFVSRLLSSNTFSISYIYKTTFSGIYYLQFNLDVSRCKLQGEGIMENYSPRGPHNGVISFQWVTGPEPSPGNWSASPGHVPKGTHMRQVCRR